VKIQPTPFPQTAAFGGPATSAATAPSTPFATLVGGDDQAAEPEERALGFLELGMFGARAAVLPLTTSVEGMEDDAATAAAGVEDAAGFASPSTVLGDDAAHAQPVSDVRPFPAARPILRTGSAQPEAVAGAFRRAAGANAAEGSSAGATLLAESAADPLNAVQEVPRAAAPAAASAPPPVQRGSVAEPAAGAAPAKTRPQLQGQARTPLSATLVEQDGVAKLAIAAAALAPGERAQLRALGARLLAEHGLGLDETWINGGSEPAPAQKGGRHGARTR